ncbi:MAG: hypothetical protein [Caudoviricetes sp.]|nr:MAG: hypothetical protein [Caudoviricetes sp.]
MSNAVAPIQQFKQQLTAMSSQFGVALPSHIKPEKFQRVVLTVVQSSPDLLEADRQSLFDSCIKCASDGLIPDGREAALTIFNTKVKRGGQDVWIKKAQYLPMFTGIQKRVRNSGLVDSIQAHIIKENDHFVWQQGMDDRIDHQPLFPGDRGKTVGAYAIAKFKDGSYQFEVMDINELNRVKNASKSSKFGPWVDWFDEMARKTVFKRLAKWLPLDSDVDEMIEYDNATERDEPEPVVVKAAPKRGSKLDAIVAEEPKEPEVIVASPEPENANTSDERVNDSDDF